jgi:hypothetical protein
MQHPLFHPTHLGDPVELLQGLDVVVHAYNLST